MNRGFCCITSFWRQSIRQLLLLSAFFLPATFGHGAIRHLYLTWSDNPCHTIAVHIHGLETSEKIALRYGIVGQEPHTVMAAGHKVYRLSDERVLYHVTLRDLLPGTSYQLEVEGNKYYFRTLPLNPPYILVEGGDWEVAKNGERVAQQAALQRPHGMLLGGDYPSNVFSWRDYKKWDEWLDSYTKTMITEDGHLIPFVAAIGNHDLTDSGHAPFYFHYFHQAPQSYFTFPLGEKIRLFVLDSGHVENQGGAQTKWLAEELSRAKEEIKMALYHVPLYPSIRFYQKGFAYDMVRKCFPQFSEKLFSFESSEGRKHWLPLFDRYGLTCAFEHHDQCLKRTKFLKNGRVDNFGTLYLGDGAIAPLRQFFPLQKLLHTYFEKVKGDVQFFWRVDIEDEKITYTAIDQQGKILDECVQTRSQASGGIQ